MNCGLVENASGTGAVGRAPLSYVLITPARNEATFIERTIKSVVAQNLAPLKWVIVNDGSTDSTAEIVQGYASKIEWIELVNLPGRKERHFAAKVQAFNAGLARVKNLSFDLLGSMDADISFEPDLFAFLVSEFAKNPKLGVAGAPFRENGRTYDFRFSSIEHVSGACQLFRRDCFDAIGGYVPVPGGGIDVIAVLTARMKGWQTRTFPQKWYDHHRPMGTAGSSTVASNFKLGQKDYRLGNSLIWQLGRAGYQLSRPPLFLGGGAILLGYLWALVRRVPRAVSPELMRFQQKQQFKRLRKALFGGAAE